MNIYLFSFKKKKGQPDVGLSRGEKQVKTPQCPEWACEKIALSLT